jgi:hypothetical protein
MGLLSKTLAIEQLRAGTGHSEAWCTARVERMKKHPDGKRFKVHPRDLADAIDEVLNPSPPPKITNGIRGFSKKKIAQLRANRA